MVWGQVASAGLDIGAAAYGNSQAKKAAKTMSRAAMAEGDMNRFVYGQQRTDLAPYRDVGSSAMNAYARAMGLPQSQGDPSQDPTQSYQYTNAGKVNAYEINRAFQEFLGRAPTKKELKYYKGRERGNQLYYDVVVPGQQKKKAERQTQQPAQDQDQFGGFFESPGYQFAVDQGAQGLDRNMAARGLLNSGARGKAMTQYRTGMANQEFGNYLNQLGFAAGIGQNAANTTVTAAQNYGSNASNAINNRATARASGYLANANAVQGIANGIGGALPYMNFGRGGGGGGQTGYAPVNVKDMMSQPYSYQYGG